MLQKITNSRSAAKQQLPVTMTLDINNEELTNATMKNKRKDLCICSEKMKICNEDILSILARGSSPLLLNYNQDRSF